MIAHLINPFLTRTVATGHSPVLCDECDRQRPSFFVCLERMKSCSIELCHQLASSTSQPWKSRRRYCTLPVTWILEASTSLLERHQDFLRSAQPKVNARLIHGT